MKSLLTLSVLCGATAMLAAAPRQSNAACEAALETVNWVREKLAEPNVAPARLEQLLAVMELRSGSCPTVADLWAYRAVVERALKKPERDVVYSRNKALELGATNVSSLADVSDAGAVDDFDPRTPIRDKWAIVVGVGTFKDARSVR